MGIVQKCECIIVFTILIPTLLLIFPLIYLIIHKKRKYAVIYTVIFFIVLIFISLVPVDITEPFEDKDKVGSGGWFNVYNTEDKDYVRKKQKNIYEICSKVYKDDKRCLIDVLYLNYNTALMWKNMKYINEHCDELSFVPNIKNIDEKNLTFDQEKCRVPTKDDIPIIEENMKLFNEQLKKLNVYATDMHSNNIMMSKNGTVKFTDGEIVNKIQAAYFPIKVGGYDRILAYKGSFFPIDTIDENGILQKSSYL
jgi:hypothetical protein